jgi:hypothetical protein
MADTRIQSVFGAYAEQLQVLVDTRLDKFTPTFFQNYFGWGIPRTNLTYTGIIGRQRIEAAATVIARGSKAPLRSRPNLDKLIGEVSNISVARSMDEMKFRDYLEIQNLRANNPNKVQQILQLIWEDLSYCANAALKRIDIMVCQAMSTGYVAIDTTTNPDGVINSTPIDLLMPAANINTVAVVWSVANKATMTPLVDIIAAKTEAAAKGITFSKMLMRESLFWIFAYSDEVVNSLKAFYHIPAGSVIPTIDQINTFLSANLLPTIELVNVQTSIEKDGVPASYNPWFATNVALIPDGMLGTIFNSYAIEELKPVAGVNYALNGRILLSKWATNDPWGEITKSELNAFPGFEAIDSCFLLTTATAT